MAVTGSNRVLRGGSWNNTSQNLRSANRNDNGPDDRNSNVGFRLVSTKMLPEFAVQGQYVRAQGFVQAITQCQQQCWTNRPEAEAAGSESERCLGLTIQFSDCKLLAMFKGIESIGSPL
jgi:Sulfatase-modifying factor enzyme 1